MLENLIKELSYFGFFLSGLISSSTIFIPIPFYFLLIFAPKIGLNPIISSIFASIGSTIGETTSYFFGQGISSYLWEKIKEKHLKYYKIVDKFFKKYGDGILVILSVSPIPFDFIGIFCGFLKYDLKKFLIITFIGKLIKMLLIVYLGEIALNYFGW